MMVSVAQKLSMIEQRCQDQSCFFARILQEERPKTQKLFWVRASVKMLGFRYNNNNNNNSILYFNVLTEQLQEPITESAREDKYIHSKEINIKMRTKLN
jgi:hypothetical protein